MNCWKMKTKSLLSQTLWTFFAIGLFQAALTLLGAIGVCYFGKAPYFWALRMIALGAGVPSLFVLMIVAPLLGRYYAKNSQGNDAVYLPAITSRAGMRTLSPRIGIYFCVLFSLYFAAYVYFMKIRDRPTSIHIFDKQLFEQCYGPNHTDCRKAYYIDTN